MHDVAVIQALGVVLPQQFYVLSIQLFGVEIKFGCQGGRVCLDSENPEDFTIADIGAVVVGVDESRAKEVRSSFTRGVQSISDHASTVCSAQRPDL